MIGGWTGRDGNARRRGGSKECGWRRAGRIACLEKKGHKDGVLGTTFLGWSDLRPGDETRGDATGNRPALIEGPGSPSLFYQQDRFAASTERPNTSQREKAARQE